MSREPKYTQNDLFPKRTSHKSTREKIEKENPNPKRAKRTLKLLANNNGSIYIYLNIYIVEYILNIYCISR